MQIFGQVLGHALGQHRDQRAIAAPRDLLDLAQEVVDLGTRRADLDRRIDEAGRADHLLDEDAFRLLHLPMPGRRRDMHGLRPHRLPFLEPERAIVHAGRQAETVFGERRLAPIVAAIHAADLRDRHMALVGEDERVVGQIFEQGRRRLAGPAAGQIARIVLDAGAGAGRLQHFQIEQGALLEPLRLEQAPLRMELVQAQLELDLHPLDRLQQRRARRHIMRIGVDFDELEVLRLHTRKRIELDDRLDLVAEHPDAPGAILVVSGEHFDRVAAHAEQPAREIAGLHALVLQRDEILDELALVDLVAELQGKGHRGIGLDRADAVDAGDGGDDDDVVALEQRPRGRVAHAVDLLVDVGFLLDIGVGARHVGFGLVIIVVGDEIFDRIIGEEALELAIELRGQRLVGREDQSRPLGRLDHLGHGEGLARTGDAEQHLVALVGVNALEKLLDRARLIALRLEFGYDAKRPPALGLVRARRPVRQPRRAGCGCWGRPLPGAP